MALIKFGGGILEMRGSIGGNVFSRNRSGAYVRARTKPVNPKTQRQSAVRALMAAVTAAWLAVVTAVQRTTWKTYASNVTSTNKLGEVINLTGFNRYVQSNMAAQNAGLPAIADGPTIFTLPGEDVLFDQLGSEATQTIDVTFDDTRDWVDEDNAGMIIQVGIPQDETIDFFDGPWRHADTILGDGTTPPTTPATIASPYPIAAGQKLFVRGRIIRADGRLGDWFRQNAICGA